MENGIEFLTDLIGGQKTGWFFDHRENRARVASLAMGKPILDVYSYLGGFGISAAVAGASNVICVDRSHAALDLATRSAEAAGVSGVCKFEVSDAFTAMETLKKNNQRFGIVIADPPAFVKSRKGLKSGLRGYRKLARLSSSLVEPVVFSASRLVHNMWTQYYSIVRFIAVLETQNAMGAFCTLGARGPTIRSILPSQKALI